jgi:putative DNA primase/helicase
MSAHEFPTAPEGSAYAEVFEALETAGCLYAGATDRGGLFTCPVHSDETPSLAVDVGRKRPLFYCFPCCGDDDESERRDDFLAGVKALGVPMDAGDGSGVDWGDPAPTYAHSGGGSGRIGHGDLTAVYTYKHADGKPNFKVYRFDFEREAADGSLRPGKSFQPRRFVDGRFVVGLDGVERTPYKLDRFEDWSSRFKSIYLVEGEKAADALLKAKRPATTFHGGTNGGFEPDWVKRYGFDRFSEVRVWPDADEAGVTWARARAAELEAAGIAVSFRGRTDVEPKDDAFDVLARGQKPRREPLTDEELGALGALKPSAPAGKPAERREKRAPSLEVGGKRLVSTSVSSGAPAGDSDDEDDSDPLADDEATAFKDARLAYRFAAEFEKRGTPVVYAAGLGWFYWTGKRWQQTDAGAIRGKIMNFALGWLQELAGQRGKSDERDKVNRLLDVNRATKVVNAMGDLIRIEATDFDAHPNLLNAQNGVVDLRDGTLRPHDPKLFLTKITRVRYVEGARSPDWEKAKQALPADVLDYLLDRLGQACTGHPPGDDKVVFNVGGGGNGKSTFLDPPRLALGDYADMVPQKLLLANPNDHPTEFMTLRGVRLAVLEELPEQGRLNTQRLKTITGTEVITARAMRRDFITFKASHALFVNTNHSPNVIETDHGTWRRLEQIAFRREYRDEKDETLRQRVKKPDVLEAVLAELVGHARKWYAAAQMMPESPAEVAETTQRWRGESDDVLAFFNEHLEPDPGAAVAMQDVLEAFNEWLDEQKRPTWSPHLFKARLRANEALPVRYEVEQGVECKARRYVKRGDTALSNGPRKEVWKGVRWVAPDDG